VGPRTLAIATLVLAATPAVAHAQPALVDGGLPFCTSASDCGNPYLACAPTPLDVCRDADASSNATSNPALADAAVCPATSREVLNLCVVRYQLTCDASASCGPAGFTCAASGTSCDSAGCVPLMRCQYQYTLCSSDSDCPAGWSCYSPSGGLAAPPGSDAQGPPKACYPPFAMFNGPAGGLAGGGSSAGLGSLGVLLDAGSPMDAASQAASPASASGGGCAVMPGRGDAGYAWLAAGAVGAITLKRRGKRDRFHD
jgi:hypothetical protein